MIQPRELRIGNYVKLNNTEYMPDVVGQIGTVTKLTEKIDCRFPNSTGTVEVRVGLNEYHQFSEFIEPIELTEEWLLNLGFRKSFRGKWEKDELAYDIYGGNGLYMHGVTPEIKYVHQLQNLYFALTGKELTIKE